MGGSSGLVLQAFDSSGREVKQHFTQMYDEIPPDETETGALNSIEGNTFTAFDTQIPVRLIFPRPRQLHSRMHLHSSPSAQHFAGSTIYHDRVKPNKDRSNVKLLAVSMSEADALQAEMLLVRLFGRIDVATE
jgi:hypothetical protein